MVEAENRTTDMPPAVSEERWRKAQDWELAFWNRQNIPSVWWKRVLHLLLVVVRLRPPPQRQELDDRNHWWKRQFRGYADLPRSLGNVCELGCGPYTNVRLIIQGRTVGHIHCSDPLARHYVTYPNAWLANAVRAGRVSVDSHPAEDCPFRSDYFDLTVLINVLDHVQDAQKCLREAVRITAPGGYLVFGQDLTGADDHSPQNPGHPFLLTHQQLEVILESTCETVLRRLVPREDMSEPAMHYGALVFIGRKWAAT